MSFVHAWIGLGFWGLASTGFANTSTLGGIDDHVPVARPAESVPSPPQSITIPLFKPKEFPFVTTIPDDGEGKGGGWQVAKVNLEFIRIVVPTNVIVWHCPFKIEMPLRPEKMGKVDAKRAARFSAEITNVVADKTDHALPQGVFCDKFIAETRTTFKSTYPFLGAAVKKW